ncbi:hypothetical protein [Microbacterium oleivorans]|uniref:hypothetical protein n=1 Tax=Microbacterium oleivorans TaxID=273677 RepID=UPI00204116E5|nr:hypothetical protein [Microbacterium oleivorans]MCM3695198.1 hypothetical protein [Microbacterium oleivorans]
MAEVEWHPVHGVLMTSEPIEAYGGVAFPRGLLESFADRMNGKPLPFHLDHDLTKPIRMRGVEVFAHDRSDGITELRFRAEIHANDVRFIESRPAMSATVMTPLARDVDTPSKSGARLQLGADHAWFDDEALIHAEERLVQRGVSAEYVLVQRAYQFAVVPDPQIYIEVAVSMLLSIGASAIWDGIKALFARRRTPPGADSSIPTTVNIQITHGNSSLRAVVTTAEAEAAHRAIEALDAVATGFQQDAQRSTKSVEPEASTSIWDDPNRRWTPPS